MTHLSHRTILGGATLAALATSPVAAQVSARDRVPAANNITMFVAMSGAKRPVALQVLEGGGYGFGTRLTVDRSAMAWPALFANFATRQGILV